LNDSNLSAEPNPTQHPVGAIQEFLEFLVSRSLRSVATLISPSPCIGTQTSLPSKCWRWRSWLLLNYRQTL